MNLDGFIIICFCTIDELLPVGANGKRLRQRGPTALQLDQLIA